MLLEHVAPFPGEEHAVALCSGAPHCGPFRAVQESELHHSVVGHYPGVATQCINFAYDLSFGHSPHRGVAGHLCDGLHVHRGEQHAGTQVSSRNGRFATGMAGTYHNDIINWKHK